MSALRSGAAALKAENADLRAARERARGRFGPRARGRGQMDALDALDVSLPLDALAPAAARRAVADCLRDRVAPSVLANVTLIVSELVTNSVRHSDASAGAVRVQLTPTMVRVEVEDSGRRGVIVPRTPDLDAGGGFGMNIVQTLSERWGLERVMAGGTRVWAQLSRAPLEAPEHGNRNGGRAAAPANEAR